jgi:hypothetical protein
MRRKHRQESKTEKAGPANGTPAWEHQERAVYTVNSMKKEISEALKPKNDRGEQPQPGA